MTNLQLQIDFETKFNKLAGKTYLSLSLEEIDWYLNEAMYQYIFKNLDRKTNVSGEDVYDTKERLDNLKTLFTKTSLPVFVSESGIGSSVVPPDFLHLVEANALVAKSCTVASMEKSEKVTKYFVVPLTTSFFTAFITAFNIKAIIEGNPITLVELANIQNKPGSSVLADLNYMFVDRIIQYVNTNNTDFSIYWENYDSIYRKTSFIIVYKGEGNITGGTSKINALADVSHPLITFTKTKLNYTGEVKKSRCRLEANEMAGVVDSNPFYRSKKTSPVIYMFNGAILTRLHDFDVSQLDIVYIRKPLVIDYNVEQAIELGDTKGLKYKISQEIVDMAVANAAARLLTPNTQVLQQIAS